MGRRSLARKFSVAFAAPLALVATAAAACSFQDFEYLQGGPAAGTGGSSSGGAGGSGNASGMATAGDAGESGAAGDTSISGSGGGAGEDTGGSGGTGGTGGAAAGTGGTGGGGAVGPIVNPSFETGNTSGWTVEPTAALTSRHLYVQWPTGDVPAPQGKYELSTWHLTEPFVVEIFQTMTDLEDGTYVFKGYFSRGAGLNEASLFARNCGGATDPAPVPIPETGTSEWRAISVPAVEVAGGSCEIGVRVDSNADNWLNADLFTFEKEE